jgi:dolichol-phosphate mannosyltransferase
MSVAPIYSVVVPFYNEADNLPLLIQELDAALGSFGETAEIVLVNDGSMDRFERPAMSPRFPILWLDLDRNCGQSAAMYAGMQAAVGDYFILLDADLQNDPADAVRMASKLRDEKLDLVTGVRQKRQDNWVRRKSSQIANAVRSTLLRDHTSDTGCTLKVIRREAAQRLPLWNGMHRFIPALVLANGFTIGEMPVNHRARHAGVSKVIGTKRAVRATIDLLGMLWLVHRQVRGRVKRSG